MTKLNLLWLIGLVTLTYAKAEIGTWSYGGEQGPENWHTLSSSFKSCQGDLQSPININSILESKVSDVQFFYHDSIKSITNKGYTISLKPKEQSAYILFSEVNKFKLVEIHFHTPSEHQADGKSYAMEVHLVHLDEKGNVAVVAVEYDLAAEENKQLNSFLAHIPSEAAQKVELTDTDIPLDIFIPQNKLYYNYLGSLTTPPCTEGVTWIIMKEILTISEAQLNIIRKAIDGIDNNRPLQKLNERMFDQSIIKTNPSDANKSVEAVVDEENPTQQEDGLALNEQSSTISVPAEKSQ